ncbi:MAG: hypothetical protein ACE5GQ_00415 [Nitrospinales bacterium]
MENRDDNMDMLITKLWTAINTALVNSKEVKEVVDALDRERLIEEAIDYNLVVDTRNLIQFLRGKRRNPRPSAGRNGTPVSADSAYSKAGEAPISSGPCPDKKSNDSQFIDGRELTENEMRFESFLQSRFDEKKWMKNAGIRF